MSAYATRPAALASLPDSPVHVSALLESFIDQLAEKVAERLKDPASHEDDWLDTRAAAEYLGLHRDTIRRLAAERSIPSEQEGPGCKLFFRRSDLDAWRAGGRELRLVAGQAR